MPSTQVEVDLQLSVGGHVPLHHPEHVRCRARGLPDPARRAGARPADARHPRLDPHGLWRPRAAEALLCRAIITVVGTSFAEGGSPELEVSGSRRDLPADARHQRASVRAEDRSSDAVAQGRRRQRLRRSSSPARRPSNRHARLEPADRPRIPRQARREFLHPQAEMGILRARRRAAGTSSISGRAASDDAADRDAEVGRRPAQLQARDQPRQPGQRRSRSTAGTRCAKKKILGVGARRPGGRTAPIRAASIQQPRLRPKEAVLELRYPVKIEAGGRPARRCRARQARQRSSSRARARRSVSPSCCPTRTIALARPRQPSSRRPTTSTKTVHRYDTSGYRTRFSIERPVA